MFTPLSDIDAADCSLQADMHIAYHNSRLNPALPWSKQDLNNTLSYIEAVRPIRCM
jgi:hypothetical protein